MKVSELIDVLRVFPQDADVYLKTVVENAKKRHCGDTRTVTEPINHASAKFRYGGKPSTYSGVVYLGWD